MGCSADAVEAALKRIHAFDPPGVAARSVQECLLLQLTADAEPDPVSVEIVEKHFEDLERRRYAEIARVLKLPLERVMESIEEIQSLEPKPGRRFSANDSRYVVPDVTIQKVGERLRGHPQRGGHPAPAGQLALPLAAAPLGGRGQAVCGAEAAQRGVADQERRAAAAHAPEGRPEPGELPARLPRQGPALPAAARPARRGRRHQHARVHHQPGHHQQVRPDPAGPLRAEVLLPQRHRLRERLDGLVGVGEEDDPRHGGRRGRRQAALRPGDRPGRSRARASPSPVAPWPSTARSSASCPRTSGGCSPRSAEARRCHAGDHQRPRDDRLPHLQGRAHPQARQARADAAPRSVAHARDPHPGEAPAHRGPDPGGPRAAPSAAARPRPTSAVAVDRAVLALRRPGARDKAKRRPRRPTRP